MPQSHASSTDVAVPKRERGTRVVLPKDTNPMMKPRTLRPFQGKPEFVEHQAIFLPTIKDGPVALGDIWNCRTNSVEGNLFDQPIDTDFYLSADPIQCMDYTFHRCFNTKDVNDILNLSAELKLEFTGSIPMEIEGKGKFDKTENTKFNEENIVFSYDTQTYQVRVRPSASSVVSRNIRKCIEDGVIVATHFVQAITLGGQATGQVRFSENSSESKMNIEGSLKIKAKLGPVTIDAQAEFKKLDEVNEKSHSVSIQLSCQPRFDVAPVSCEEMFAEIKKVTWYTAREQHFPNLTKVNDEGHKMRVEGVPLRFRLVPLAHILFEEEEEEVEDPIQGVLSEQTITEYTEMLETLKDFSHREYLKRLLAEMAPNIVPILHDDFNPITVQLREKQLKLSEQAHKLHVAASRLYSQYKTTDTVGEAELVAFINGDYKDFDIIGLHDELLQIRERCKKQLVGIRAADVTEIIDDEGNPAIRFFTNLTDLLDWYVQERTHKILMKTDFTSESPNGVFLRLYDLAPLLKRHGVQVGVALPNISYKHLFRAENGTNNGDGEDRNELELSLTFKTQYETNVYYGYDMRYFLELMSVAVDEGDTVSRLFYTLNCSLSGLRLPMEEHLYDIPNLMIVMRQYVHEAREEGRGKTIVCETYCGLLARLAESYETWNFVFPIEASYTSVEMMRFYRQLRVYVRERFPTMKHQFLVAQFVNVSDQFYSPNLLLFRDDVLKAVCLDQLDILLMMEQFAEEKPNWDLLSFRRMRESCLYPPRARWAIRVVPNLILDHQTYLSDPIPDLDEFPPNPCDFLPSALIVTRVAALRDEPLILTTLAHLALEEVDVPQALTAILEDFGYRDNAFQASDFFEREDWKDFQAALTKYMENEAPWLMKVVMALDKLGKINPDKPDGKSAIKALKQAKEDDDDDDDEPEVPEEPKPDPEEEDRKLIAQINRIIAFLEIEDLVYTWHGRLVKEEDYYEDLKPEVERYRGTLGSVMLMGIMRTFEMFIAKAVKRPEIFHLYNMIALAEGLAHETLNSLKHVLIPMTERYCERILTPHQEVHKDCPKTVDEREDQYPRAARRIDDAIRERQLFKAVGILSEMSYSHKLFIIHQELFNMYYLPSPGSVQSIVEKMTLLKFDEDQLRVVWTNPKFLYILRQVMINESVLDTLIVHVYYINEIEDEGAFGEQEEEPVSDFGFVDEEVQEDEEKEITFPYWMPPDVVEKVKELIAIRQKIEFPWEKDWISVDVMISALKAIYVRKMLPSSFPEGVRGNMEKYDVVRKELEDTKIPLYWDEDEALFTVPWSITTLSRVLLALSPTSLKTIMPKMEGFFGDCPVKLPPSPPKGAKALASFKLNRAWARLTRNGDMQEVPYSKYIELDSLVPKAKTEYDELYDAVSTTLRFLIQRGKMNDGACLKAKDFENYIKYPALKRVPGQIDFGEGIPSTGLGFLLTRGDYQTALAHVADPAVTFSLLTTMAKAPVPLPFIVTSIEVNPEDEGAGLPVIEPRKSIIMIEALKDVIVPEMMDLVPQPRLFREPFRFILTLRVGDTMDLPGRSSFVNRHLMRDGTFFASRMDPGAVNGRALNRTGFLEFGWLAPTTCNKEFWELVKEEYEDVTRKHMILLGLLHGDALSQSSVFEYVLPYVSSIVVFWKVKNFTELKKKQGDLAQYINPYGIKTSHMVFYPDTTVGAEVPEDSQLFEPKDGSPYEILNKKRILAVMNQSLIFAVNEIPKLRVEHPGDLQGDASSASTFFSTIKSGLTGVQVPGKAIKGAIKPNPVPNTLPIRVVVKDPLGTPESRKLFDFIEKTAIVNIQHAIRYPEKDNNRAILRELTEDFTALVFLPPDERVKGLIHFSSELDLLSRRSSAKSKARIQKLRDLIEAKWFEENGHLQTKWTLDTQEEMKMSMEALRTNTLSVMDLWRLLWGYSLPSKSEEIRLLEMNAEYIESGFPVEMFHYSYNEVPWEDKVGEALEAVDPETRILVISIFGAKNSGKSSLLNSLFGHGFTEGGTTNGLQLRLLYLNPEMRVALDCDAFVVIDSEGIIGEENKIDPLAHCFERRIASFLLGISSVSLASVMGGTMKDLGSVLEIAFTSLEKMDRLAPVTPDLYVVQNFVRGQTGREAVPQEINAAIFEAVEVTTDLPLQAGLRTTQAHRMKMFKSRNRHAEIVHTITARDTLVEQDESFVSADQDIRSLYAKILEAAATSRDKRVKLREWIVSTTKLWENIQGVDIPFTFPTVPKLRDGLTLEDRISEVKRAIEAAYRYHEKKLEIDFVGAKPSLDDIFEGGVDAAFEGRLFQKLNALLKGLNAIINTCEDEKENEETALAKKRGRQRRLRSAQSTPDACYACSTAFRLREELFVDLEEVERGFLIIEEIMLHSRRAKDSIFNRLDQGLMARRLREQKSGPSSDLVKKVDEIAADTGIPDADDKWLKFYQYVSTLQSVIPARIAFHTDLEVVYRNLPHVFAAHNPDEELSNIRSRLPPIKEMIAFDVQIYNSALESSMNVEKPETMSWMQYEWLRAKLEDLPKQMKEDAEAVLYKVGMAAEVQSRVQKIAGLFEEFCGEPLTLNFRWEVHIYAILLMSLFIGQQQEGWDFKKEEDGTVKDGGNPLKVVKGVRANNPTLQLEDYFASASGQEDDDSAMVPLARGKKLYF